MYLTYFVQFLSCVVQVVYHSFCCSCVKLVYFVWVCSPVACMSPAQRSHNRGKINYLSLLLFHTSNSADFTAGRESVNIAKFFSAEKLPNCQEVNTGIIKSTGSCTSAGEHSATIVGLKSLYQPRKTSL